jgi:hypothetical protein
MDLASHRSQAYSSSHIHANHLGQIAVLTFWMVLVWQMSRQLGLVFNPEALELFAMNKLFLLHTWLNARKVPKPAVRINDMMRILGFGISEQLYSLLEESPHP